MNAFSEIALAVFLISVLANNKETELVDKLRGETGFFKWAIALGIVIAVSEQFEKAGKVFMFLVFTAMALTAVRENPKTFDNLASILRR